jgi:hypothetical protein
MAEVVPPAVAILHMAPAEGSRSLMTHPAGLSRLIDPPHVPLGSPHELLHRSNNLFIFLIGSHRKYLNIYMNDFQIL